MGIEAHQSLAVPVQPLPSSPPPSYSSPHQAGLHTLPSWASPLTLWFANTHCRLTWRHQAQCHLLWEDFSDPLPLGQTSLCWAPTTLCFCPQWTWLCTCPPTLTRVWASIDQELCLPLQVPRVWSSPGLDMCKSSTHVWGMNKGSHWPPTTREKELPATGSRSGCFFHSPFLTGAKRVPRFPSLLLAARRRVRRGAFIPSPDGWSWDGAQQLCLGGRQEGRWPGVCLQTAWEAAALVQDILRGRLTRTVVKWGKRQDGPLC